MSYFKTFTISKIGSKMLNLLFYEVSFFFFLFVSINASIFRVSSTQMFLRSNPRIIIKV